MRDPNRIRPFLEKLGELWIEKYPDMRFGQVVELLNNRHKRDMFNIEEDVWLDVIQKEIDRTSERKYETGTNRTHEEVLKSIMDKIKGSDTDKDK